MSDGMTEGTADGSGARRQLQRRAAIGTVDEHRGIHGGDAGAKLVTRRNNRGRSEIQANYFVN